MDFAASLKNGLEIGSTKDQFLNMWENENKSNGKVSDYSSQSFNHQISEDLGTGAYQTDYFWHKTKDELRHELSMTIEQLFDQHMDKQRKQWELEHMRNNQMADDLRRNFDILCKHVTNTVETQVSALKLHLMQEFDLLRHNFAQIIAENNVADASGTKASASSHNQIQMDDQQGTSVQQHLFDGLKNPVANPKQKSIKQVQMYGDNQQVVGDESLSAYNWGAENPEVTSVVINEHKENFSDTKPVPEIYGQKSESYDKEYIRSAQLKKPGTVLSNDFEYKTASLHPQSALPKQASTEATGFYADAISNQMKQNYPSDGSKNTNSRKSNDSVINAMNKEEMRSIIYASMHSNSKGNLFKRLDFTINNSDKFSISGKAFLSPFIHSRSLSWKVQLSVSFDAAKQLKVCVLVSNGEHDSIQDWPLQFNAMGSIFHQGSREFTQVWQLPTVTCKRPTGTQEVAFPAEVCLSTLRGSYPDVNYDELKLRHYATNNQLIFQWNFNAKKFLR